MLIGHKHCTTSWKLEIQQWVVWKESKANCKRCKTITILLPLPAIWWRGCVVQVWVWGFKTSLWKGLFSKLKMITIHTQHHRPEKVEYIGHAAGLLLFKTFGNTELGNLRLQWVQDNLKKTSSDWENTFWTVIQLEIPSQELRSLSRALTWRSLMSWFNLVHSTINPENARLWWESFVTNFLFKWT